MVIRRIGVLNCIFHALVVIIQQMHEKDTETFNESEISCFPR